MVGHGSPDAQTQLRELSAIPHPKLPRGSVDRIVLVQQCQIASDRS